MKTVWFCSTYIHLSNVVPPLGKTRNCNLRGSVSFDIPLMFFSINICIPPSAMRYRFPLVEKLKCGLFLFNYRISFQGYLDTPFHGSKNLNVGYFFSIRHPFDKFKGNLLVFYLSGQIWTMCNCTYHDSIRWTC